MSEKFKNHADAWQQADMEYPPGIELIRGVQEANGHVQTREDFRWYVLFNHIRSIDAKLNPSKRHTFLRRIQDNILLAAERMLR